MNRLRKLVGILFVILGLTALCAAEPPTRHPAASLLVGRAGPGLISGPSYTNSVVLLFFMGRAKPFWEEEGGNPMNKGKGRRRGGGLWSWIGS